MGMSGTLTPSQRPAVPIWTWFRPVPAGTPFMTMLSAYCTGYEKASALDPELATRYVEHTVIGDPVADAVIEAPAPLDVADVHRFIHLGHRMLGELAPERVLGLAFEDPRSARLACPGGRVMIPPVMMHAPASPNVKPRGLASTPGGLIACSASTRSSSPARERICSSEAPSFAARPLDSRIRGNPVLAGKDGPTRTGSHATT